MAERRPALTLVTVAAGFLDGGRTTLIARLLRQPGLANTGGAGPGRALHPGDHGPPRHALAGRDGVRPHEAALGGVQPPAAGAEVQRYGHAQDRCPG